MSYYVLDLPRRNREVNGKKLETKEEIIEHVIDLYTSIDGNEWSCDYTKTFPSYEDMCEYIIYEGVTIEQSENDIRKDDTIFCLGYPSNTNLRKYSCKSFATQEEADEYRYQFWANKYSKPLWGDGDLVLYNSDKEARDMYDKIDVTHQYKKELGRLLGE